MHAGSNPALHRSRIVLEDHLRKEPINDVLDVRRVVVGATTDTQGVPL